MGTQNHLQVANMTLILAGLVGDSWAFRAWSPNKVLIYIYIVVSVNCKFVLLRSGSLEIQFHSSHVSEFFESFIFLGFKVTVSHRELESWPFWLRKLSHSTFYMKSKKINILDCVVSWNYETSTLYVCATIWWQWKTICEGYTAVMLHFQNKFSSVLAHAGFLFGRMWQVSQHSGNGLPGHCLVSSHFNASCFCGSETFLTPIK